MRPPEETLAAFEPVAQAIGVSRIAHLTGLDVLGVPVYAAYRPLSRSLVVSMGKGVTPAAAKASALMESIETWHAENLAAARSDISYRELVVAGESVADVPRLACYPETSFDEDARTSWVEGVDLFTGSSSWVPWEAVSLDLTQEKPVQTGLLRGSNGLASGNTMTEAVLHALCEIVERDAEVLWRMGAGYRRVKRASISDSTCVGLIDRFMDVGLDVALWDITSDIGIPAFGCTLVPRDTERFWRPVGIHDGYGCHPRAEIALSRALTEAAQTRMAYISGSRDDLLHEELASSCAPELVSQAAAELASVAETEAFPDAPDSRSLEQELDHVLSAVRKSGAEQAVMVNLTRPDFQVPVVKVLVPGLEGPAGAAGLGARALQGGIQ
ncbi:YcaO-like family protein [Streptomyces sp. NBC_01221]|uniref:YcaO-like family protein n=1 Tax=Streptomyces sp. NBC_01221 TaxID=2903782 RepID=UPI0022571644|nr:YcaO-like family protein [Streptomyces sp. NBC_01221]MCX4791880.1 YcaO-like family protein [Streptomyces sp. NBC_01221]